MVIQFTSKLFNKNVLKVYSTAQRKKKNKNTLRSFRSDTGPTSLLTSTVWMLRSRKMNPDSDRKTKSRAYLDRFRHMVSPFCLSWSDPALQSNDGMFFFFTRYLCKGHRQTGQELLFEQLMQTVVCEIIPSGLDTS